MQLVLHPKNHRIYFYVQRPDYHGLEFRLQQRNKLINLRLKAVLDRHSIPVEDSKKSRSFESTVD